MTCGRRGHTRRGGDRTPVYSKRTYERMCVSYKYGVCVCMGMCMGDVYVCVWMKVCMTCGRRGHTRRGGDRTPVFAGTHPPTGAGRGPRSSDHPHSHPSESRPCCWPDPCSSPCPVPGPDSCLCLFPETGSCPRPVPGLCPCPGPDSDSCCLHLDLGSYSIRCLDLGPSPDLGLGSCPDLRPVLCLDLQPCSSSCPDLHHYPDPGPGFCPCPAPAPCPFDQCRVSPQQ